MKLYDALTPNTLRVQVFLAEKGIDVPRQKIDVLNGGTRTPEFLALNPLGELPLMELDDGRLIAESVAICRYFEWLHPEPALMGTGAADEAHVEMWNRRMELHIFWPLAQYGRHTIPFFADKVEQVPDYAETEMRRFDRNWAWLDRELADGRPYIAGNTFTIADITGMAALMVCGVIDKALPQGNGHAARWADAMRMRPSFTGRFAEAA